MGFGGKEFGRFRRFLFCFLFIHFSKHPFCFHYALKRMRENSGSGVKRERRILELRSLANPFSVKICVLFCAVMKRWKEKNCPTLSTTRPAKRTSDSWSEELPHSRLIPLTSSLPEDSLREWFCPRSDCPWFVGQELPREKYLIPLSHTCGVRNPNTERYFDHIFTIQLKGNSAEKESPPVETNEEIS